MQFKVIEIRDRGTCIPAMAMRMIAENEVQWYYLHRREGYPEDGSSIMLMKLSDGRATNDPYGWQALGLGPRTLPIAHQWIIRHYDEIKDGDVVDVEFILEESPAPKVAERITCP